MIDHNGHVHDANYNIVFSEAINQFNYQHGLSLEEREQLNYTLFTVEEHTALGKVLYDWSVYRFLASLLHLLLQLSHQRLS